MLRPALAAALSVLLCVAAPAAYAQEGLAFANGTTLPFLEGVTAADIHSDADCGLTPQPSIESFCIVVPDTRAAAVARAYLQRLVDDGWRESDASARMHASNPAIVGDVVRAAGDSNCVLHVTFVAAQYNHGTEPSTALVLVAPRVPVCPETPARQ